jgi:ubiquinone/menaquinone biosynthesis C-methylase UbiE
MPWLRLNLRVLDAGCGTGVVGLALRGARRNGARAREPARVRPDPAMLERFRGSLARRRIADVELRQADVLRLETLPDRGATTIWS